MQRRHQDLADRFGHQPTHVVEAEEHRRGHAVEHEHNQPDAARRAVTFARDRNLEREAVVEVERETIDRMRAGQGQHSELVTERTRDAIAREY
ncbi:MAG: hypothetical protein ACREUC_12370, partial [Steroidobacteraceae bacterium]